MQITQIVMLDNALGGVGLGLLTKGTTYTIGNSTGQVSESLAQDLLTRQVARAVVSAPSPQGAGLPVSWTPDGRAILGPDGTPRAVQLLDQSGRPLDRSGRPLARLFAADVQGGTVWFPLNEGTGNKVNDAVGQLVGSIQGGSSGQRWGQAPGLSFNGSNNRVVMTDGSQAGFNHSSKFICDLSTLAARGDMIVVWCVVSHPATLPADCQIVSWGCSADANGGWSVGLKATSGKQTFSLRAKGGSSAVQTPLGTSGARGANSDNTRTALAWEIAASGVAGLLEVRAYQITLGTDGGNSQSNVGLDTPAMVPNGTSIPDSAPTAPITIGAWPTTDGATFSGFVGPNMSIVNLGLQRRPFDMGIGMRIARDLRNNNLAFPPSAR